jgi:hypothetical protein
MKGNRDVNPISVSSRKSKYEKVASRLPARRFGFFWRSVEFRMVEAIAFSILTAKSANWLGIPAGELFAYCIIVFLLLVGEKRIKMLVLKLFGISFTEENFPPKKE